MKMTAKNCSVCRKIFDEDEPRKDSTRPRDPELQACVDGYACRQRILKQVRQNSRLVPPKQQFEEIADAACGIICTNADYIEGMTDLIAVLTGSLNDARTKDQEPTSSPRDTSCQAPGQCGITTSECANCL